MKRLIYSFSLVVLISSPFTGLYAQKQTVQEHQIKAIFLFNFIQFVEWPSYAFDSRDSPVIIGILGTDPFNGYLEEVLSGEIVNGRSVTVKRYNTPDEIENCQMLYIQSPPPDDYKKIVDKIKGKNILTISDDKDFIENGGMIRFVNVNNRIQFQINPEAAKAANLTISSKLLRLAEIVAANEVK